MKKLFQSLSALSAVITCVIFTVIAYAGITFPDNFEVNENSLLNFEIPPFSVSEIKEKRGYIRVNSSAWGNKKIHNMAKLSFFNIFPVKTVCVNVAPKTRVIPCGTPFGVKIHSCGAIVTDVDGVNIGMDVQSPGKTAGLRKGDVIIYADQKEIFSNESLESVIEESEGKEITLEVLRDEKKLELKLTPLMCSDDNKYRAGIWVRDGSAGIGTLTFCRCEDNIFAGLGHGICDCDTGNIVPLERGDIVNASIIDVNKGESGVPGELVGCFCSQKSIGKIYGNSSTGVYGSIDCPPCNNAPIEVGMKQQVKKGMAKILSTIDGDKPRYYDINIDSVNYNVNSPTKNLKISIIDKELLEKTGGIVQGMSGSPIIQNGLLVGAITHVFVNNPVRGYGIFAETMLTNSAKVFEPGYKKGH